MEQNARLVLGVGDYAHMFQIGSIDPKAEANDLIEGDSGRGVPKTQRSRHGDEGQPVKTRFRGVEMRNKRLLVLSTILVLTVVSVLMVAACGSETTETTAAGTETTAAATETTAAAEEVLIRVTTPVPGGDEFVAWAQEGMDRFNARTNGAYKMEIFPGGQLGPFPESLDAIRTGAVEAGMIPLAAFTGSVPEFGLVELPFLFDTGEANAYAMPSIQTVWDEVSQEKANQRVLGCIFVGTQNFLSTVPIKTLEDMNGLIVGVDAPPTVGLVEALGASGIVVDFTEDYSNLQKGVVDARTSAPQYIEVAKLYEVAKYFTVFHGIGSLYAFTINSDVYDKMPADIQAALNEEMSATAASISEKYVTKLTELEPVLTDLGMEWYYLPSAERDRWKDLIYSDTMAALDSAGEVGASVKQIADEANTKYPYTEQ